MKALLLLTVALAFALVATVTFASPAGEDDDSAMAAEKEMVLDPTTGQMVTAPEYGGTFTFAVQRERPTTDPLFGGNVDGVAEKMGMVNWGIDRDVYDLTGAFSYFPESVLTGRLAESWETPDASTIVFKIREGVHWHDKAPMNGRELTAQDIEYNFHRLFGLGSGFTAPPATHSGPVSQLPVESVTATDKFTVEFKLKQPQLRALPTILARGLGCFYSTTRGHPATRRREGLEEPGGHRAFYC